MVNILFYDDSDALTGKNVAKTLYDPACGTGGMLSVAEEYLHKLNSSTQLLAFGQELNDQTFAICKADMLIKGNDIPESAIALRRMRGLIRNARRSDMRSRSRVIFTGMRRRNRRRRS